MSEDVKKAPSAKALEKQVAKQQKLLATIESRLRAIRDKVSAPDITPSGAVKALAAIHKSVDAALAAIEKTKVVAS